VVFVLSQEFSPRHEILIVDDEPAIIDLMTINFQRLSGDMLHITAASDGEEALQLTRSHPFDVVVADYCMPKMDGVELLKRIRSLGNEVPYIIVTGMGREEVVIEALNYGADMYLQKGGDPTTFFSELHSFILKIIALQSAKKELREMETSKKRAEKELLEQEIAKQKVEKDLLDVRIMHRSAESNLLEKELAIKKAERNLLIKEDALQKIEKKLCEKVNGPNGLNREQRDLLEIIAKKRSAIYVKYAFFCLFLLSFVIIACILIYTQPDISVYFVGAVLLLTIFSLLFIQLEKIKIKEFLYEIILDRLNRDSLS
jgi:CheY-like chemotaxis protein